MVMVTAFSASRQCAWPWGSNDKVSDHELKALGFNA